MERARTATRQGTQQNADAMRTLNEPQHASHCPWRPYVSKPQLPRAVEHEPESKVGDGVPSLNLYSTVGYSRFLCYYNRENAMRGPRFEQTVYELQPTPLSAMQMISEEPIRLVEERIASCDGGGCTEVAMGYFAD